MWKLYIIVTQPSQHKTMATQAVNSALTIAAAAAAAKAAAVVAVAASAAAAAA